MAESIQLLNQHLLWRAGFGPMAEDFQQTASAEPSTYVKALFNASAKVPAYEAASKISPMENLLKRE